MAWYSFFLPSLSINYVAINKVKDPVKNLLKTCELSQCFSQGRKCQNLWTGHFSRAVTDIFHILYWTWPAHRLSESLSTTVLFRTKLSRGWSYYNKFLVLRGELRHIKDFMGEATCIHVRESGCFFQQTWHLNFLWRDKKYRSEFCYKTNWNPASTFEILAKKPFSCRFLLTERSETALISMLFTGSAIC